MFPNSLLEYPLVLGCIKLSYLYPNLFNVLIANGLVTCNQTVASPEYVENVVSSMKTNNVLLINQNAPTVEENTPLVVKLAPKNRKIISYEKVLVGKCTPQQARVEIKTQLKPANKPKGKVTKVTVPSVTNTADTENTNNIVLSLALILGKLPKKNDPKTKIEYLTELAVKIFDIKLNVEHILTKYLSLY